MLRQQSFQLVNRVVDIGSDRLRVYNLIGEGGFSDVYRAQSLTDNQFYALKKIRLVKGNYMAERHLRSEINVYKTIARHPNIVHLFKKQETQCMNGIPGDREFFLLYELCQNGNLFEMIQMRIKQGQRGLEEAVVLEIATHIIKGLLHLHMQDPPIAHRDLKPENVILGTDNNWKLCDFGSSTTAQHTKILSENRPLIEEEIKNFTTRLFQAPEQIDLYSGYPITEKVDIFGLGCLIYTLLFFKSPFDPEFPLEQANGRYKLPQNHKLSKGMQTLLQRTLTVDPAKRISSYELWSILDSLMQRKQKPQMEAQIVTNNWQEQEASHHPVSDRVHPSQQMMGNLLQDDSESNRQKNQQQLLTQRYQKAQNSSSQQPQNLQTPTSLEEQKRTENTQNGPISRADFDSLSILNPTDKVKVNVQNWVTHYCQQTEQAPREQIFRYFAVLLINEPQVASFEFMKALGSFDKFLVIAALKVLAISHRAMLYCPRVNYRPFEKLFKKLGEEWKNIHINRLGRNADIYRTAYSTRLIFQYSELLLAKVALIEKYGYFVDTAYVLQPDAFKSKREGEKNVSVLNEAFLMALTRIWDQFQLMQDNMFAQKNFIFSIRLSIAVNLIEDQYLIMCLLSHLNLTLKVVFRINQQKHGANNPYLNGIRTAISQFDTIFAKCQQNFQTFVDLVKQQTEFSHLVGFLPQFQPDLLNKINEKALQESQRLAGKPKEQVFEDLLQVHRQLFGMMLPVRFEIYPRYESVCNFDFEIVLANPQYRFALDKKLADNYFQSQYVPLEESKKVISGASSSKELTNQPDNLSKSVQSFQKKTPDLLEEITDHQKTQMRVSGGNPTGNQRAENFIRELKQQNYVSVSKKNNSFNLNKRPVIQLKKKNSVKKDNKQKEAMISGEIFEDVCKNVLKIDPNADKQLVPVAKPEQRQIMKVEDLLGLEETPSQKQSIQQQLNGVFSSESEEKQVVQERKMPLKQNLFENQGEEQERIPSPKHQNYPLNEENKNISKEDMDTPRKNSLLVALSHVRSPSENQENPNNQDVQNQVSLPPEMYTCPASEDAFQYRSITDSTFMQMLNQRYLQNDRNEQSKENGCSLSLDCTDLEPINDQDVDQGQQQKDLKEYFDQNISRLDNVQEAQEQEKQLEQDYTRMLNEQKVEKLRQSQILEDMIKKESDEEEIKQKRAEIEQLKLKFEEEQHLVQTQKRQLKVQSEKLSRELAKFEEEKRQNSESLKRQIEEMKQLKEMNQKLVQENQSLKELSESAASQISSAREKQTSQIEKEKKVRQNSPAPGTNMEIADEILNMEFNKTQDYFKINLEDLQLGKMIGSGASAEVFAGTYKENDVAIKKLRFFNNSNSTIQTAMKEFKREISTLKKVRHNNLVNFVGACIDIDRGGSVYILTEYCFGGSLFDLLHAKKQIKLTFKQRYRMCLDIAKGMNFLHIMDPPILHRDLKSLNLLLSEEVKSSTDYVQVKVTDFGLSRSKMDTNRPGNGNSSSSSMAGDSMLTGMAGTYHWMAPEVFKSEQYSTKADVYSYGIVLWEIICREPPFKNLRPHEIIARVVNEAARPDLGKIPPECPKELIIIMQRCWAQNPDDRPNFNIIIKALKKIENLFV